MGQKLDKTHQTENKCLPVRHWRSPYTITLLFYGNIKKISLEPKCAKEENILVTDKTHKPSSK